jgi:hypothetical protein
MNRVFISYASPDKELVQKIASLLKQTGHSIHVDWDMSPSEGPVTWMNNAIERATHVVIVYSSHSPKAKWQPKEIEAAIAREREGKAILLTIAFENIELPPLLGTYKFHKLKSEEAEEVQSAIEWIADLTIPQGANFSLIDAIKNEDTSNPFWRLRAENYESAPYLLAKAFSSPSSVKWGTFQEIRPCIVEGSRGTGKTMLLMALRARNYALRHDKTDKSALERVFGVYLKLWGGAFAQVEIKPTKTSPQNEKQSKKEAQEADRIRIQRLECFSQEFYLHLVESLIEEIEYCVSNNHLTISREGLEALLINTQSTLGAHPSPMIRDIGSLKKFCAKLRREMGSYIRRKFILDERSAKIPIASLDKSALTDLLDAIRNALPALGQTQFTFLLDEYENLRDEEKVVVNDLIKYCPDRCSIKVAKKFGTTEFPSTSSGQPLQEIHDYNRINLTYHLEDNEDRKKYFDLLEGITRKALSSEGSDAKITEILPEREASYPSTDDIENEISRMQGVNWRKLDSKQKQEKIQYYKVAAIHRIILNAQGKKVHYSGFDCLAFLSSGVVRYFLEIVGTAYHFQWEDNECRHPSPLVISPENQSRAAHFVSEHNLASISRSTIGNGELLKYFLTDLGDIVRSKLLYHDSEPEAAIIQIQNPESLSLPKHNELRTLINIAIQEGVLQQKEGRGGMRAKHRTDAQSSDYHLSRIYAPVLQYSYRMRWRTKVTVDELQRLIEPQWRREALARLHQKVTGNFAKKENQNQLFLLPERP